MVQELNINLSEAENNEWLRKIDLNSGHGDKKKSLANVHSGINHRMANSIAPKNMETMGLTFFTRPDMRIDQRNGNYSRKVNALFSSGFYSDNACIIAALDPYSRYLTGRNVDTTDNPPILGTPFMPGVMFDNKSAFIPLLSNRLVSLTGFPDTSLDVYTSSEGIKREQWSMVDSTNEINQQFNLSATFANIAGDPLTTLFNTWLEYMAKVYVGDFLPRTDNILRNRIDYQTRIYRLILDPSKRFVTMIGIANACFPLNDNIGAIMNVSVANPYVSDNDQVSIQFNCIHASYRDPILVQEFNDVVTMFNPDMLPTEDYVPGDPFETLGGLVKLAESEKSIFNYQGYPRIDPYTMELQWWVYSDVYEAELGSNMISAAGSGGLIKDLNLPKGAVTDNTETNNFNITSNTASTSDIYGDPI